MKKIFFIVIIIFFTVIGCKKNQNTIGAQIEGDFNGDGKTERAILEYLSAKRVEDTMMYEYSITFTDEKILPITLKTTYRKLQLINEGDLNEDKADDISISQEMHPQAPFSIMRTLSFMNNKWNCIIEDITIHLGFETLSPEELQDIVVKKENVIMYYMYDDSLEFDENFTPKNNTKKYKEIKLE